MTKKTFDHATFRRMSPEDQLRALRGQQFEREFSIERAGIDEKARTAWMSIASEEPYERWWGIEILDITPGAIVAERLKSGAALLVDHDPRDVVGVVERFEITRDRRLRILARFGRSARAEEVFQDVCDGIRRNTSVGYRIHDLVLEQQEEEISTYRVTAWEPYEGSLVAVPADPSVGVGRNFNLPGETIMPDPNSEHPTRSQRNREDAEAQRVANLYAMGEEFQNHGGREAARVMIDTPGASMEDMRKYLAVKLRAKVPTPTATAEPFSSPFDDPVSTPRHRGNLHPVLLRQFDGDRSKAESALYGAGQWLRAKLAGNANAARWCLENGLMRRDSSEGVNTDGGFLAPSIVANSVIDFTIEYAVARRECRGIMMGSDTMQVPVRSTGVSAYFIGEAAEATKSSPTWGSVGLTAKKLAVLSVMSSEVQEDAVIDLAAWVAMECGRSFAEKEDACWIDGDGTSAYGGMTGIRTKLIDGSHDAGKVLATSGHDTFPEIDITDLGAVVAALPQPALRNAKWYCSQAAYGLVFQRLIQAAGGITLSDMVNGPIRQGYFGFPIVITEKMPAGASTDYSGEVMLMFGDMTQASLLGSRREITVKVDGSRYLEFDQIAIMATERFHINNHGLGTNSVAGAVVALVGN